jgi:hypothetical protein
MSKEELEEITGNVVFPLFIQKYPFRVEGEFSSGQCFLRGLHVGLGDGTFYIDFSGTLRVPDCGTELKETLDKCAALQDNDSIKKSIQDRGALVAPSRIADTYDLSKYDHTAKPFPRKLEEKKNLTPQQIAEIIAADPQGAESNRYCVWAEGFGAMINWQNAPEIAKLIDSEITPEKATVLDLDYYVVCAWSEDESLCLDPVNEWVLVLLHETNSYGEMEAAASSIMSKFATVAWTEDGFERPWSTIPDSDRQEICDLIVEARVDREEQFSKITDLLKGLLWPGFWSESEEFTWSHINSMIESM